MKYECESFSAHPFDIKHFKKLIEKENKKSSGGS